MRSLSSFTFLLSGLVLAAALAVGCQSKSPTEPRSSTPISPIPPPTVTTYSISVTASPSALTAGGTTSSSITIHVTRTDTGQPPADLTSVTVTTSLGEFGSIGSGQQTATLQLVGGQAQVSLFPGTSQGTATIRAQVGGSAGAANVTIGQQATFFVSSIDPGVGNPNGGEEVAINGGGFDGPARVTFNGATADVLSLSANRIRVRTPSATAAGVTVGVGQASAVDVSVTINLNEPGQLTDTLASGFTYAAGGGVLQPEVFSISPASGSNDGGTRVTIVGDGFEQPVQVFFGQGSTATFNGVEATVESVTRTRIVALTPAARGFGQDNLNQTVSLLVRNLNTGFSTVANQFFRYGSNVLITAMGPGSGSYLGGTRVTIFGQGFDEPVAVSLGSNPAIAQLVLSVTGSEVIFLTTGIPLDSCPASGVVTVQGVSVTNIDSGDSATASNLAFNYIVPLPLIFGISPNIGSAGTLATVNGQNFAANVQVLFGDAASGSSANIRAGATATSIPITVPTEPPGFAFNTQPCDGNGDGIPGGTQSIPTPISVTVRNLDGTGCVVTLSNAFTLIPSAAQAACTGDTSTPPPPPQCSDGIDNDSDGLIDFPADPQCTSATDNNEAA
jgi:IPT/TIG domain